MEKHGPAPKPDHGAKFAAQYITASLQDTSINQAMQVQRAKQMKEIAEREGPVVAPIKNAPHVPRIKA